MTDAVATQLGTDAARPIGTFDAEEQLVGEAKLDVGDLGGAEGEKAR